MFSTFVSIYLLVVGYLSYRVLSEHKTKETTCQQITYYLYEQLIYISHKINYSVCSWCIYPRDTFLLRPLKDSVKYFINPLSLFFQSFCILLLQQLNGETISIPNYRKIKPPINYGVMTLLSQAPLNK